MCWSAAASSSSMCSSTFRQMTASTDWEGRGQRRRSNCRIGTPVSRVGLTLQQVMGVPVDRWGTKSLETNRAITEIMV